MTKDQKKLMMIQNIIDANNAYMKKFCQPLEEHIYEAICQDNYNLNQIKKVLQGNFDI